MNFFEKILPQNDLDSFFLKPSKGDGTIVGDHQIYDPKILTNIMNVWCRRIDKVIRLDKKEHKRHTWRSVKALRWRGFTFKEFFDLFNPKIDEDTFVYRPVFNQVNKKDGGIETEEERQFYLNKFQYNEESFVKALQEADLSELLEFFFAPKRRS